MKVRNANVNRDLFKPMVATHTSQHIEKMYDSKEQKLIQELTDESIVLGGYMIYYVFRTEIDVDPILFEPNTSTFSEAFQIAATFPQHVMGWGESNALLNKFGLLQGAEGEFIISQKAWDLVMQERKSQNLTTFYKPREGDLIVMYAPQRWAKPDDPTLYNQNKIVFQITYTDGAVNNWQFGKDYVWRVSASAYRYDESETLDANDDNDLPLFDVEKDFNKPDQSDDYADYEKEIKVWDENHPFGGY